MPFEVFRTTADHIIGATDAALQNQTGVDVQMVASFLDTQEDSARAALSMGEQLGLLQQVPQGRFKPLSQCALYLITSSRDSKAAILRFLLEQYGPYRTFKFRLNLTNGVVGEAAVQTRAIHAITAHRDVLVQTFVELGTYSKSLISQGAGLYLAAEGDEKDYLHVLDQAIQGREDAELTIRRRVGLENANWVDQHNVLDHLVTAYERLSMVDADPRAPIVHAANSIESMLAQVAQHHNVNIQGAHGINAIADRLSHAKHITTKHKAICNYLGHVRNAVDHGADQEIAAVWTITSQSAVEYVYVASTIVRSLVDAVNNRFSI